LRKKNFYEELSGKESSGRRILRQRIRKKNPPLTKTNFCSKFWNSKLVGYLSYKVWLGIRKREVCSANSIIEEIWRHYCLFIYGQGARLRNQNFKISKIEGYFSYKKFAMSATYFFKPIASFSKNFGIFQGLGTSSFWFVSFRFVSRSYNFFHVPFRFVSEKYRFVS
jgi:hypothetical protein